MVHPASDRAAAQVADVGGAVSADLVGRRLAAARHLAIAGARAREGGRVRDRARGDAGRAGRRDHQGPAHPDHRHRRGRRHRRPDPAEL